MHTVNMPQVGQDLTHGKIVEWLKAENDPVEIGEVIAVVESEKASFEIEADHEGVLLKILHGEGVEAEVLKPIAYIGAVGESFSTAAADDVRPAAPAAPAPAAPAPAAPPSAGAARQFVSPSARRIARQNGIDLTTLTGTGPRGRVVKADVLGAAAPAPAAAPASRPITALADDTEVPFGRMRAAIARRLTHAKQTVPHFYLKIDVDMTAAAAWRKTTNSQLGARITFTDMVVQATARALGRYRNLNAVVDSDKTVLKRFVNVGVAVSVDQGLLVPVIPEADTRTLAEISAASRANAEAARKGMVDPSVPGTFTISSLGMHSVREFLPIINAPECGILGVGSITQRVVPVDGGIGVRDMMTLTLVCDHRAIDGPYAAAFLNEIRKTLENDYRAG